LAACSDSGSQKAAEAPAAPAEPAKPAEPAPAQPPQAAEAPAKPAEPAKPAVKAPEAQGTVDVAQLMQPGALPEMSLGKPEAPVTIVEYASMTCPHCAHFHATTLPELKTKYIDTGKVRLIMREFPFDPRAEAGFMLARCSKENYFPMVDVLFKQQANWVSVDNGKDALLQLAKLAGFSQQSFEACLTDQKLLDQIVRCAYAVRACLASIRRRHSSSMARNMQGHCRLTRCRRSSTRSSDAPAAGKGARILRALGRA
jgi:protein-disulfide isomerase